MNRPSKSYSISALTMIAAACGLAAGFNQHFSETRSAPVRPATFRFSKAQHAKYPGQLSAFRQGAWAGDDTPGPVTRQMQQRERSIARARRARASLLGHEA